MARTWEKRRTVTNIEMDCQLPVIVDGCDSCHAKLAVHVLHLQLHARPHQGVARVCGPPAPKGEFERVRRGRERAKKRDRERDLSQHAREMAASLRPSITFTVYFLLYFILWFPPTETWGLARRSPARCGKEEKTEEQQKSRECQRHCEMVNQLRG